MKYPALLSIVIIMYAAFFCADAQQISRAYADSAGTVHVVLANGSDQKVEKEETQSGVEEVKVAEDRQTVGWLEDYPNPDPNRSWEALAGKLLIWRNGSVLHRFRTEQVFYSWSFANGGKSVAFHTGPLHGEQAPHCELHNVVTGKLLAEWDGDLGDKKNAPIWTHSLNH